MATDHTCDEILRLLPPVLRARDFHLYLGNGRRLVDLWQLGGRAVLGHKPSLVTTELKNAAERSLFAPLPHSAEGRFLKALASLFPAECITPQDITPQDVTPFVFRIYSDKKSLSKALENAGFADVEIPDPVFPHKNDAAKIKLALWRPFLGNSNYISLIYLPVLPWALSPPALVIEKSLEEKFPPGDLVSPVILAAAARAIYDLIAAGVQGNRPKFIKIEKALAAGTKWQRQDIYLTYKDGARADWIGLWKRFLERGFLLPPSPMEPLILPAMLSAGEEAKLADLLLNS